MTPIRAVLALALAFASWPTLAVRLDANGLGQALIYPYYTARVVDGNAWTTALSLVNTRAKPKAVKLRFREGRHGRPVMEANVYLGPYDMWTGAVISESDGSAHLVSADFSCIDPPHSGTEAGAFSTASFTGANDDGAGAGVDRTLEGYVEVIEMATLGGATAAAATLSATGLPANCAGITGPAKTRTLEAPEGGLSGMAYLLNINDGLVTSYSAVALAELTQAPFYSDVGAAGTDYDSAEVTPLSIVTLSGSSNTGFGTSPGGGYVLRSTWSRGVDAVSAVLMAASMENEYVLDAPTISNTDWVVTMPTARYYNTPAAVPPFRQAFSATGACEQFDITKYNRDQSSEQQQDVDFPEQPPGSAHPLACWASTTFLLLNGQVNAPITGWTASSVVGSANFDHGQGTTMNSAFHDGFATLSIAANGPGLTSLPGSSAVELATGNVVAGAHHFAGLPVIGFAAWKYENGLLNCSGQACKGNFGVAVPHHAVQAVTLGAP